MADSSDCANALVAAAAAALYPGGTAQPSVTASSWRIFRGWPDPQALDADLAAGTGHFSVYATGLSRNTTRYTGDAEFVSTTIAATALTAVAGTGTGGTATVTFGGSVAGGELVGVAVAYGGQTVGYGYLALSSDTPATIAAQYAASIPLASASGDVLSISGAGGVSATVLGAAGTLVQTRRQEQEFWLICWAPDPALRDGAAAAADAVLAQTRWLALADGTVGRLLYRGTHEQDFPTDGLWRRDLRYTVEYPTTLLQQQPQMLFGVGVLAVDSVTMIGFATFYPDPNVEADTFGNPIADAAGNLIGA